MIYEHLHNFEDLLGSLAKVSATTIGKTIVASECNLTVFPISDL